MKAKNRELTEIARKVADRMKELGLTQGDLARRTKLRRGYLSELLTGVKKGVKHEQLVALAEGLEVPIVFLTTNAPPVWVRPLKLPRSSGGSREDDEHDKYNDSQEREAKLRRPFKAFAFPRDLFEPFQTTAPSEKIPLYADQSTVGTIIDKTAAVAATVERPPQLASSPGAYVVLADGRMTPRYDEGNFLYVAPGQPPSNGDYVFVVLLPESGDGLIGQEWRLNYLAEGYAEVESFEPRTVQKININRIAYIHRVVLAGEAFIKR